MDHTPPPEGPIEVASSNAKRVGLGLLMAILPAFAILIYINTFFSSHSETSQRALIASNALSQRATLIKADHDRLVSAVETTLGAARLAEIISNSDSRLSALVEALPTISTSVVRLLEAEVLHAALFNLLRDDTNFPGARITLSEGVRVDFADSSVHLEPLDGEGAASLRFDGDDVECRQRLERLLTDMLARKHPDLVLPLP